MEAVDGKEGEATEEIGDQRRCRWLTMAPSLPAIEVVTVEDASDDDSEADSNSGQGEFHEFQNPLLSASLAGFDIDCACANGVSDQQFRELKHVNGIGDSREQLRSSNPEVEDDLKERFWSSGGSPKESRWGEEESSPTVNELPRAVIKESVRDHGNAKIIDRLPSQGAPGSRYPISGHKTDNLAKGATGCRGTRIRPWRGPLP
jgi:hypothetical protein